MFSFLFEAIAAATYLLGYGIITLISYLHGDHHCLAYALLTIAAVIHFGLLFTKRFARRHDN